MWTRGLSQHARYTRWYGASNGHPGTYIGSADHSSVHHNAPATMGLGGQSSQGGLRRLRLRDAGACAGQASVVQQSLVNHGAHGFRYPFLPDVRGMCSKSPSNTRLRRSWTSDPTRNAARGTLARAAQVAVALLNQAAV